jgi:hypothetical protein
MWFGVSLAIQQGTLSEWAGVSAVWFVSSALIDCAFDCIWMVVECVATHVVLRHS